MKKYRVGGWKQEIKEVDVERESESSVWINGRRNAKITSFYNYFDSRYEACEYLIKRASIKLQEAERRLSAAKKEMLEAENIAMQEGQDG